MQVINKQFRNIEELRKYRFLPLSSSNTLIQVWTGYYSESEVIEIFNILKSQNLHFIGTTIDIAISSLDKTSTILKSQNLHFVGTTTAGEIFKGRYAIKSIVISISIFEKSQIAISHFAEDEDYKTGIEVAKTMVSDLTKILILFGEGLKTNGDFEI